MPAAQGWWGPVTLRWRWGLFYSSSRGNQFAHWTGLRFPFGPLPCVLLSSLALVFRERTLDMCAYCPPYLLVPIISSVCEAECRHQQYLYLFQSLWYIVSNQRVLEGGMQRAKPASANWNCFSLVLTPVTRGILVKAYHGFRNLCFIYCPHVKWGC